MFIMTAMIVLLMPVVTHSMEAVKTISLPTTLEKQLKAQAIDFVAHADSTEQVNEHLGKLFRLNKYLMVDEPLHEQLIKAAAQGVARKYVETIYAPELYMNIPAFEDLAFLAAAEIVDSPGSVMVLKRFINESPAHMKAAEYFLIMSVKNDHKSMVHILLSLGVDPDAAILERTTERGLITLTPITVAIKENSVDMVQLLLKNLPSLYFTTEGKLLKSFLKEAISTKANPKITQLLIKAGAVVTPELAIISIEELTHLESAESTQNALDNLALLLPLLGRVINNQITIPGTLLDAAQSIANDLPDEVFILLRKYGALTTEQVEELSHIP